MQNKILCRLVPQRFLLQANFHSSCYRLRQSLFCLVCAVVGLLARTTEAQVYTLYSYHVQNPNCADTFDVVNITVTISVDSSTADGVYQWRWDQMDQTPTSEDPYCNFEVHNGLITTYCDETHPNASSVSFPAQVQPGTGGGLRIYDGSDPSHKVELPYKEGGAIYEGGNCPPPPGIVYTAAMRLDFGQGQQLPPDLNQTKLCDENTGCSGCSGQGMASYSFQLMLASLRIEDTPISYKPPRGSFIDFKVVYNQRENQPLPFAYSNLGSKWTFNWFSYVTDDPNNPGADANVYVRGGGTEVFSGYNPDTQSYFVDKQTLAVLVRTSSSTYEKRFRDGSKEVFSVSDMSTSYPRHIFLSSVVDPTNNPVTLSYDGSFRIMAITDSFGRATTFAYDLMSDPLKITKVTDPFLRVARFDYTNGQLTKITDPLGIESQFSYQPGTDFINSMITPYGPTTFAEGETGDAVRWVEATDPRGGKERVEYNDSVMSVPSYEPVAPAGVYNIRLDRANTYYWDKKAMADAPGDYTAARVIHWLTSADGTVVSGIKHSEKRPLESRIWYSYAGQSDGQHVGVNALPTTNERLLDDGSPHAWRFQHNSVGNVIQSTDPVGRVMSYAYDTNNIDLLGVYQERSGGSTTDPFGMPADLIASYTYNSLHEPLIITDAAGQPTTNTYNSYGQILSVENARHETTTYGHGENGNPADYLTSITSPIFNGSSATAVFDYQLSPGVFAPANRPRKVTNLPDNYTVATDYDDLDRPTQITYPDGTTQQFQYVQNFEGVPMKILDLTASKDRDSRWTYRHYNGNRQMDSITDPLNQTTLYDWCTCGSLVGITDPNNNTTTFNRDLQSRIASKVFVDNSAINYIYENTSGRLKSMTDANGQTTNYQYYADDDLKQVSYTNPLSPTPTVSYTYDSNYNRITSMTDGIGTTNYTYYPVSSGILGAGRLYQVDGPFSNDTITYAYDELGRVKSQDINGTTASVIYDSLGRLSTTDNPLGHFTRTYESDVTPRLHSLTYPNGQTASYNYFGNANDRRLQTLRNLTSSAANISKFDYTFDPEGQIQTWKKTLGASETDLSFNYDDAKQLLSVVRLGVEFDYNYDPAGNRFESLFHSSHNHHGGNTYTVNNLNQLDSVTRDPGVGPAQGPVPITYDASGNMTYDGNNQTFEWDAANRLVAINYLDSGNRTEFAYDGLGRRVKITEKGPGMTTVVQPVGFDYTAFSSAPFLIRSGDYVLSFEGLDPNGGDNTAFIDAVTLNDTLVPNGSFESPTIGYPGYQYNPSDSTWSFDSNSGLSGNGSGFTAGNPNAPDGLQVAFVQFTGAISQTFSLSAGTYTLGFEAAQRGNYNASFQQLRITLQSLSYPTTVKTFLWSGNTIAEERNSTGSTPTKRFFAEGEQRVGGAGAGNYYYTRDHLGSIREVTDSSGNLVTQLDYDAWGNEVVVAGGMNVDFGFTGHYFHQPSGLNFTRTRAYNATLARWISRDWIAEAGGLNLYGYVADDPLNKYDPFGLQQQQPEEDTPDPLMGGAGTSRGQNQIQDIGNFASKGATTVGYPDDGKGFFKPPTIGCQIWNTIKWLFLGKEILDKYNLKCKPPNNSCDKNAKDNK